MKKIISLLILLIFVSISCKDKKEKKEKVETNNKKEEKVKIPPEYLTLSFNDLNKKGFTFHSKKDYTNSSKLFLYATIKDPTKAKGFFNLACAYSLLGKSKEAIIALKKAAKLDSVWTGKNINDSDLNNIKTSKEYISLKDSLNSNSYIFDKDLCAIFPNDMNQYQIFYRLNSNGTVESNYHAHGSCNGYKFIKGNWKKIGNKLVISQTIQGFVDCNGSGKPMGTIISTNTEKLVYNSPKEFNEVFKLGKCK